jgi:hypothetical protein
MMWMSQIKETRPSTGQQEHAEGNLKKLRVSRPTATQEESYSALFLRRSTISPPNRTAANTQMIRTIEASIVVLLLPAAQRFEKP